MVEYIASNYGELQSIINDIRSSEGKNLVFRGQTKEYPRILATADLRPKTVQTLFREMKLSTKTRHKV